MLGRELMIACLAYAAVSVDVRYSGQWAPQGWEPQLLPIVCVAALGLLSVRRRVIWAVLIGMLADVSSYGWIGPQMCCASLIAIAACLWLPSVRRLNLPEFVLLSFVAAFCMSFATTMVFEPPQAVLDVVQVTGCRAISTMLVAVASYVLASMTLRLLPRPRLGGRDSLQHQWPMLNG